MFTHPKRRIGNRLVLAALSAVLALSGQVAAEGPAFSGFIDFGYNYNFNGRTINTLRGFDANANSLTLQNAELVAEGRSQSNVGYRVDVDYGYDASLIHSAGFTSTGNGTLQTDIQQAYITVPCPLTRGTVTVGKFVTQHGAEVIEAKDDYNISRGFLFTYAIPYTHTGVKWDKAWGDAFTTMLGVVNGWDNLQDNNKGKTLHAGVGLLPKEKISLTVSGTYGPEQTTPVPPTPSTEKNSRSVVDTILKVSPTDKLTLIANHDWGIEEGLVSAQADNTTYNWQGLALYAVYGFTDDTSAALRWETFDDEGELSNQSRLGLNQPVVLHSLTATLQRKHNGVIYRLEYRQDDATRKVFFDNKTLPDDTQSTVGAQIIYAF